MYNHIVTRWRIQEKEESFMVNDRPRTLLDLRRMQKGNKRYVIWALSAKVKKEVEEKYEVEEYLYRVTTKHLSGLSKVKNKKLIEQHKAFKSNKKTIILQLKEEDKEAFRRMGVKFAPVKYKIWL